MRYFRACSDDMKRSPVALFLLFTFGALQVVIAQPTPPTVVGKAPLELEDGDTIVFLGDSITHQCLYTQYLEDYFYTRFPDRRIRCHNAGVSGDRAGDALARFDEDVAAFEPQIVTVLLGMNDGKYEDYDAATFATYTEGMTKLLEKIAAIGAKAVVMSPTMFDHHQLARQMNNPEYRFRERSFDKNYNALLAYYGGWLRERSGERGLAFADLWGPMNESTFSERRREPDFTLVPDAIHPAPAGHLVMAYELLTQVPAGRDTVGGIVIHGAEGVSGSEGVTDLVVSPELDGVSFSHLATALPWVLPEQPWLGEQKWDAEPGVAIGLRSTVAGHRRSNEQILITGLAPGRYELRIDDGVVGEFSHLELGFKVELQSNSLTPQYQQALAVAVLNRERNDQAMRPLRDQWGRVKGLRSKARNEGSSDETEPIAEELSKAKAEIQRLLALGREYENRIHVAAQPVARKYELVRLP
jgi:lysophospholipase L1-like esterase